MRTRQSICGKKAGFASEDEARGVAARSGLLLLPYRCDRCGKFHLTSRTKGKAFGSIAFDRGAPSNDGPA